MFYLLFDFIIDVLIIVNIGLWMHIHMIIKNRFPIKGQKYEWRYVCVLGLNTSTGLLPSQHRRRGIVMRVNTHTTRNCKDVDGTNF